MNIAIPQRKNLSVNDLVFDNDFCACDFVNAETREIEMSMNIIRTAGFYEFGHFATNNYPSIIKLVEKFKLKAHTEGSFDECFYELQKRLKGAVRDRMAKENPSEEVPVEEVEAVEVPEAKLPKQKIQAMPQAENKEVQKVVKVQIERPNAVGLEGQIHELVYACLESEYTVQTLQNKMIELGLDPHRTEIVVKKPNAEPKNVGSQHREFQTILQTISAGVNLALVGPAGSGKTTCVHHVAEALSLPFYSKSVSAQTGVHEFFGYQDANGNYVRTLFREAYENGGVFLLDEFDAGNPNVLASMNQATANGSCAFADGMVQKHSDFVVVMAGNTYGHGATSEYVGRNAIDKATLDRFAFIYFDYDEQFELALSVNKEWTKEVQAIRKRVHDKRIKTIVSPRASFDGAKLLASGMKKDLVKKLLIYKGLTQDEINMLKS